MGPRNAYKDMLDKVVSPIDFVNMNHQNQLEQMANGAMFATGKKLDKFESRSGDGIFFGYASHSRAYCVLNLEFNQIVESCEVTFDETQPRSQLVFECAGDDELGEEIFQEEEHELGDDEDGGVVPPAEHVPTTSTTVVDSALSHTYDDKRSRRSCC
jgi:hypothetical protein